MPEFRYGGFAFTFSGAYSGYGPKEVRGPDRQMYVVEHQIPAREGGIIEYLGSQQSTYQFKGFLVQQETGGSTSNLVLSGGSYVSVNADDAKDFLKAMRGSGIQLLRIESTYSMASGYPTLYENGFFQIEKLTLALEAGRSYPYYPYGIDFRGATPSIYGNTSGVTAFKPAAQGYYSGFMYIWQLDNQTKGEVVNTLGIYIQAVSSGSMAVAVYSGTVMSGLLTAQSAPQLVHSGWNYFPIRPSFVSVSGFSYKMAFIGNATSSSGFVVSMVDLGGGQLDSSWQSGITFPTFPAQLGAYSGANTSGVHLDQVLVAGQ